MLGRRLTSLWWGASGSLVARQAMLATSAAAAASPIVTSMRSCSAATASTTTSSPDGSVSSPDGSSTTGTALDVAMKVNKLKRLHQTGQAGRKQLELTAWKELNTLSEDQINTAEGKAVALLLNSWAYFAKHWERGKEGPIGAASEQQQQPPQQSEK